jgi:SRSO17 transposase
MGGRTSDWKQELGRFLKPFLDRLGHKARRQMCPLYVSGLIGPGDRKSIQPMAKQLALGDTINCITSLPQASGMRRP